jgi:Protein of unknown function (DUF3106)
VTVVHNAERMRCAILAAAIAILCVPGAWARGQRPNAPPPRAAVRRFPNAQARQNRPQYQGRPQGNPGANPGQRTAPGYGGYPNPGGAYQGGANRIGPYAGQNRPGYANSVVGPAGHLGDWLNAHRGLTVDQQERVLRNDPSFNRLPAGDQQRLVDQLHRLNQMPEEQRQRRLAWGEALEHMSPQDRLSLNASSQRLTALPPDRKALVRRAFQDLSAVPVDQRQTVLNSARYQGVFSPEERGILSDFLRVEPYEPPH